MSVFDVAKRAAGGQSSADAVERAAAAAEKAAAATKADSVDEKAMVSNSAAEAEEAAATKAEEHAEAPAPAKAAAPPGKGFDEKASNDAFYKGMYDALYDSGYHGSLTHISPNGGLLMTYVGRNKESDGVKSVLDVGCSHGLGVSLLWKHGLVASG